MAIGKFHGVMMPMTPTGSRVISTRIPGRTEGSISPASRRTSPAKNLKMYPARAASPIPSGLVLPSSRASRVPSSSFRAMISLPILSSASDRAWMLPRDQAGNAARATAIAARTCASSARAYSPTTSATLDGLRFGAAAGAAAHSPPM